MLSSPSRANKLSEDLIILRNYTFVRKYYMALLSIDGLIYSCVGFMSSISTFEETRSS